MELSGTSMSAAVAAGAAALVLEARPGLKPQEIKVLLQLTSSRGGRAAACWRRGRGA